MFVSHTELSWMLRQVYGQRVHKDKLLRKFTNHGISSLLPYFKGIDSLFDSAAQEPDVIKNVLRTLSARINHKIDISDDCLVDLTYPIFKQKILPVLIKFIDQDKTTVLKNGARVSVRLDSSASSVKPESEGFITEKLDGTSKVKFYSISGRYSGDTLSTEIPDDELQVVTVKNLLERHRDISSIAEYFLHDSILRSMKSSIDSSVYSSTAQLAIDLLVDRGLLKIDGDEYIGDLGQIFSTLAPNFDETYRDMNLFSSHTLSCPPSERKPHALRLELTTGCDYNKCTFCSEYTDMNAETKPFADFKEHVDKVAESIGTERNRIQRLFIGSGNTLGVETEHLLEAFKYAKETFDPQRISIYGRTNSILEKSVDELKRLKEEGLSLIYWGLESGSDEILDYICKDCNSEDMIEASKKLIEAEIEVSAMLMPGVGGLKYSAQHVSGTLELLHNIEIKYLTLLAINPSETSLYEINMQSEIDNRHLTPDEVNKQVYKLIEGLKPTGFQIGMFTEEIDQASSNTKRFNCQFNEGNKQLLLKEFWK